MKMKIRTEKRKFLFTQCILAVNFKRGLENFMKDKAICLWMPVAEKPKCDEYCCAQVFPLSSTLERECWTRQSFGLTRAEFLSELMD